MNLNYLFVYENFTYDEIDEALGIPLHTNFVAQFIIYVCVYMYMYIRPVHYSISVAIVYRMSFRSNCLLNCLCTSSTIYDKL